MVVAKNAVSSADGTFSIDRLATASYTVDISSEAHGALRRLIAIGPSEGQQHEFAMQRGGSLSGRISTMGDVESQPSGPWLALTPLAGSSHKASKEVVFSLSWNGTYRTAPVAPGRYRYQARFRGGFLSSELHVGVSGEVEIVSGGATALDVVIALPDG